MSSAPAGLGQPSKGSFPAAWPFPADGPAGLATPAGRGSRGRRGSSSSRRRPAGPRPAPGRRAAGIVGGFGSSSSFPIRNRGDPRWAPAPRGQPGPARGPLGRRPPPPAGAAAPWACRARIIGVPRRAIRPNPARPSSEVFLLDDDVDRDLHLAGLGMVGLQDDLVLDQPRRHPRGDGDGQPILAGMPGCVDRRDVDLELRRLLLDLELGRARPRTVSLTSAVLPVPLRTGTILGARARTRSGRPSAR